MLYLVKGDFNGPFKIPKQLVEFPTRGKNKLDLVFCNLKDSYVANSAQGIRNSDFKMVKISSKFHPVNKRKVTPKNRTVVKTDYAKLCRLMEK